MMQNTDYGVIAAVLGSVCIALLGVEHDVTTTDAASFERGAEWMRDMIARRLEEHYAETDPAFPRALWWETCAAISSSNAREFVELLKERRAKGGGK